MIEADVLPEEAFVAGAVPDDISGRLLDGDRFDLSFCQDAEGFSRRQFVERMSSGGFEPFHYRLMMAQRSASIQMIRGVLLPERGDPAGSVRIMTVAGSLLCGRASVGWCPGALILTLPAHCALTIDMSGKLAAALMAASPGVSGLSVRDGRIALDGQWWADCVGIPVVAGNDGQSILKSTHVPELNWRPSEFVAGQGLPDVANIPAETMATALRNQISNRRLHPSDMMPTTLNRDWIDRAQVRKAKKARAA